MTVFLLPVIISPGGDIQNDLLVYTTHFFHVLEGPFWNGEFVRREEGMEN
jgi:hypothetical protein